MPEFKLNKKAEPIRTQDGIPVFNSKDIIKSGGESSGEYILLKGKEREELLKKLKASHERRKKNKSHGPLKTKNNVPAYQIFNEILAKATYKNFKFYTGAEKNEKWGEIRQKYQEKGNITISNIRDEIDEWFEGRASPSWKLTRFKKK
jgi:hypothetical protein